MPKKRKGGNLSRSTKGSRYMRDRRSGRTKEQIKQQKLVGSREHGQIMMPLYQKRSPPTNPQPVMTDSPNYYKNTEVLRPPSPLRRTSIIIKQASSTLQEVDLPDMPFTEKDEVGPSITSISPVVLQSPFSVAEDIESTFISQQSNLGDISAQEEKRCDTDSKSLKTLESSDAAPVSSTNEQERNIRQTSEVETPSRKYNRAKALFFYKTQLRQKLKETKKCCMKQYRNKREKMQHSEALAENITLEIVQPTADHSEVRQYPRQDSQGSLSQSRDRSDSAMSENREADQNKPNTGAVSTTNREAIQEETSNSNVSLSNGSAKPPTISAQVTNESNQLKPSDAISDPLIIAYFDAKSYGRHCVVPTCTHQFSVDPHFSFPKDKKLCLKWLLAVPKGEWKLSDESVVCSRHFEKGDFIGDGQKLALSRNATPKLFLTSPYVTPNDEPVTTISLSSQDVGDLAITDKRDDSSESDLEIIEPVIETFEVSDTSDEECQPTKETPIKVEPSTSSDAQIKCCVPRCGSVTGCPIGVGFHSFPRAGETRLSVKSLDNKVTFHDLFDMWKSLLSVMSVKENSFVCTRHFTFNDYNGHILNKAAVPTQYLPTPVTFAPFRAAADNLIKKVTPPPRPSQPPPPLVLINKSAPVAISQRSNLTLVPAPWINSHAQRFIRIPVPTKISVHNEVKSNTSGGSDATKVPAALPAVLATTATIVKPTHDSVQASPQLSSPVPDELQYQLVDKKVACSIDNCPIKGEGQFIFRLPIHIDKCKEWVYSCGHPEWLDKGMCYAQSQFRICSYHFSDDMFVNGSRRVLKGSAKPVLHVQEPYKKCAVNTCQNYFDKKRLFLIGVEFSSFPQNVYLRRRWIDAINNPNASSNETLEVTDEEIDSYKDAVICSLHFTSGDYARQNDCKVLKPEAVPSMNLILRENKEETNSKLASDVDNIVQTYRGRRTSRGAHKSSLSERKNGSKGLKEISSTIGNTNNCDTSELPVKNQVMRRPWRGRRRRRGSRRGRGGGRTRISSQSLEPKLPEPNSMDPPIDDLPELGQCVNAAHEVSEDNEEVKVDGKVGEVSINVEQTKETPEPVHYSRAGRPLRATVVKRKYSADSINSEEEDEGWSKRRLSRRQTNYCEESTSEPEEGVRRSSRTAVLKRKPLFYDECSDEKTELRRFKRRSKENPNSMVNDDQVEIPVDTTDNSQPSVEAAACVPLNSENHLGLPEAEIKEKIAMETNGAEENAEPLDRTSSPKIVNDLNRTINSCDNSSDKESSVKSPSSPNKIEDDERKESSVSYGPNLPKPNRADFDFFQSILPTMAKFSLNQKCSLKSTIISKLKELLEEDIELFNHEVNGDPT